MARERGLYRRKDSRFWWIGLVLPDGRRVYQSTGCINRTAAESYVVRLKNEAIEAKQQGHAQSGTSLPEKLSFVAHALNGRHRAHRGGAGREKRSKKRYVFVTVDAQ